MKVFLILLLFLILCALVSTPSITGPSPLFFFGSCGGPVSNRVLPGTGDAAINQLGGSPSDGRCVSGLIASSWGTVMTRACSLGRLHITSSAAGFDAADGQVVVWNGNSATSVTCTIGTGTACSDNVHYSVAAEGDLIWLVVTTDSLNLSDLSASLQCF
jgi:hypothetical protein